MQWGLGSVSITLNSTGRMLPRTRNTSPGGGREGGRVGVSRELQRAMCGVCLCACVCSSHLCELGDMLLGNKVSGTPQKCFCVCMHMKEMYTTIKHYPAPPPPPPPPPPHIHTQTPHLLTQSALPLSRQREEHGSFCRT